jgi:hypothetical protein
MPEKKVNYTPEMAATAAEMYGRLGNDGLDEIAEVLNKTVRSVRSKLVRDGVYVAPAKPEKVAKDEGPLKSELLAILATVAPEGFPVEGVTASTKATISEMIAALSRMDA